MKCLMLLQHVVFIALAYWMKMVCMYNDWGVDHQGVYICTDVFQMVHNFIHNCWRKLGKESPQRACIGCTHIDTLPHRSSWWQIWIEKLYWMFVFEKMCVQLQYIWRLNCTEILYVIWISNCSLFALKSLLFYRALKHQYMTNLMQVEQWEIWKCTLDRLTKKIAEDSKICKIFFNFMRTK